ncbi:MULTISPECIES: ABC transporter substrate-binding protein [Limibacillus]|jgi:lysine-arginine-ornithine-binding protein|uniref:Lysine-arginine-ornithine-binding protein n=1 Tax=Limibacillus halophilus TaxID=1579333 RepID=A0A839SUC3_9PROT|nr:ABC transporter substrate-binding protein [Limibacillus halophilus]MBB3066381.1 lysine-arginine-ornithine-binding protein [Limibacillus halophilus]
MKKIAVASVAALAAMTVAGQAIAGACQGMDVRVGTEGAYPPFNSIDDAGNLVGFDIDISNALCESAGLNCTFITQDWDGIIPGLQAKKYDAIIASMSITPKRMEVVDFTGKYYNTPAKFVAAKDSNFDISPDGLAGKVVGVQRATIHEDFLRATFPKAEVRNYGTQEEANADLASGRLDLVMADSVALLDGFLETPDGEGFQFVGPDYNDPKFHGEGAGIAVRKGEDKLRECLNEAISDIRAKGIYQKINEKYFDFDVYGAES